MSKHLTLPILSLLLALSGCYRLDELSITQKNGVVSFYIDEDTLSSNDADAYFFRDFGVSRDDCIRDCIMWDIVEMDNNVDLTEKAIREPVTYGQAFEHMTTRIGPKKLAPGKYCAGGTASLIKNNTAIAGKLFHKCFDIQTSD